MDDIDTIVQGKIDADSEFQASLADLSDEDKNAAIATKRSELVKAEFKTLAEEKAKNEKIANDQKIRAEKAEKALKDKDVIPPTPPKDPSQGNLLSTKDTLALVEARVPAEDFDEVVRVAQVLGKPVVEALQDDLTKTILADRAEKRATAAAAQTRSPRGSSKVSGDDLISNVKGGKEVPEDKIDDLVEAEMARKKARK